MRPTNQLLALGTALFVAVGVVGFMLTLSPAASVAQSSNDSGWLGVSLQNLDRSLRDAMDIDDDVTGAVITDVVEGSPAERAGLREGDVILEVDDDEAGSVRDVIESVRSYEAGDRIVIRVRRDGRSRSFPVTLGSRGEVRSPSRVRIDDRAQDQDSVDDPEESEGHSVWVERDPEEDPAPAPRVRTRTRSKSRSQDTERRVVVDVDEGDDGRTEIWVHEDGDEGHDDHRGKSRVFVLGNDDDGHDERVIILPDSKRRVVIRDDSGRTRVIEDDGQVKRRVRRDAREFKVRSQGYLGVQTQQIQDQLADYFGVEGGVLVTQVVEDSPAASAGLKAGDVILSANGRKVGTHEELRDIIRKLDANSDVVLTVSRKGRVREIEATLGSSRDTGEVLDLHKDLLRDLGDRHGNLEFHRLPDLDIDLDDLHPRHQRELREGMQDLRIQINDLLDDLRYEIQHNSRQWQRELGRAQRELQRTLNNELRSERRHETHRLRNESRHRIHRELRRSQDQLHRKERGLERERQRFHLQRMEDDGF